MHPSKCKLTPEEIRQAFDKPPENGFPAILSPRLLAQLLGLSRKTIYQWIAQGRLDGAFRKRGKHVLIWRDRAVELLMCGKEWTENG